MESISFNSEETRKVFRSIFHNSLDAVLITYPTTDGDKIFYSNTAAEKLFGFTQAELSKAGWKSVLYNQDPNLKKFLKALKEKGKSKEELVFIKKDGSKFPGEITANLIVENDKK